LVLLVGLFSRERKCRTENWAREETL
jgi:hypothetical protein